MPPRKMAAAKAQPDHGPNRGQASASKKNTARDTPTNQAEEQQIDIQAAITEMLNESQQRISEALQNRQNNLLNMIMQCDNMVNSPRKTGRK
ncbi:hypothetical protein TRFO_32297 [Tritrichomonas foetus]|uniref:Uncharacterized protein n=1 Tax=Tritrichomonas foetus TaxID=1144522 RepID=A0A1J4JTS0_9EUKA|nr:hypothetical protein TRFO_32297 [Tritrichomonas foetus]|eukprot:OHT00910.1 hypothetical protein TRFO_32297 [Tritrichomonas foetus]